MSLTKTQSLITKICWYFIRLTLSTWQMVKFYLRPIPPSHHGKLLNGLVYGNISVKDHYHEEHYLMPSVPITFCANVLNYVF